MPGIVPVLMDSEGQRMRGPGEGRLCLEFPWPGQARTVWGDHARYVATYFQHYPGMYFTGDGCRRDADGYHWITGRVDDVINVSGHRMGTAEFEAALVSVDSVAEAGVVGYPHPIKGQGVYAYIVLQDGYEAGESIERELHAATRALIGAHAKVDLYQFVPGLPKTRIGQGDAPHPPQGGRGTARSARRHIDARRPQRGRRHRRWRPGVDGRDARSPPDPIRRRPADTHPRCLSSFPPSRSTHSSSWRWSAPT